MKLRSLLPLLLFIGLTALLAIGLGLEKTWSVAALTVRVLGRLLRIPEVVNTCHGLWVRP